MRYKNIFIVLILFCGAAAAENRNQLPDPTELLVGPAAKNTPSRNVVVSAKPIAAKLNNTNQTIKPATANLAVSGEQFRVALTGLHLPLVGPVAQNAEYSSLDRQLWQERISILPEKENLPDKDQLQKLVMQLRSVEFSRPKTNEYSGEPVTLTTGKSTAAEPNQGKPQMRQTAAAAKNASDSNAADATLGLVRQVCQNPSVVEDSLELAELLYIKGYLKEAAVFYQETLNRQKPDEQPSPGQKPWILYQMGNCLRKSDPASASKTYKQLIAEFPDSQWAVPAKVQDKMLDWLQKEKPADILK